MSGQWPPWSRRNAGDVERDGQRTGGRDAVRPPAGIKGRGGDASERAPPGFPSLADSPHRGQLRQLAQDTATGPIPVAAAWAAEGLQLLLGVSSAGQTLDPATFSPAAMTADLNSERDALSSAIDNLDIMLT